MLFADAVTLFSSNVSSYCAVSVDDHDDAHDVFCYQHAFCLLLLDDAFFG